MAVVFPVRLEFIGHMVTQLWVSDQYGLQAIAQQECDTEFDQVSVYKDSKLTQQTYQVQAFHDASSPFKARRMISRSDQKIIGAVQAQHLRTVRAAGYHCFDSTGKQCFKIKVNQPWLSMLSTVLDMLPIIGNVIVRACDDIVNPTYTIYNMQETPVYYLYKERCWRSRQFIVESLEKDCIKDDELILLCVIQLLFLERRQG